MLIREADEDPNLTQTEASKLFPEQGWERAFIEHFLFSVSVPYVSHLLCHFHPHIPSVGLEYPVS